MKNISLRSGFMAMALIGLFALNVHAAETKELSSQQNKMTVCNKQAGDKKGDERKAFMKDCLSAKSNATPLTQQEKMTACNKQASGKKGDDRKAFMKSCLSSKPAA